MAVSPLARHSASPVELKERLEAERRGRPFLLWRDDEGRQRILPLAPDAGRVTIGRRARNDVPLDWVPRCRGFMPSWSSRGGVDARR